MSKGFQKIPIEERFWAKVDKRGTRECWPWLASKDQRGYGVFYADGRNTRATRVSWSLRYGVPFPDSGRLASTERTEGE